LGRLQAKQAEEVAECAAQMARIESDLQEKQARQSYLLQQVQRQAHIANQNALKKSMQVRE
jgi:hypothetical protein